MRILVHKASEVHLIADVEGPARRALSNHFAFTIPGARWAPAFKSGVWDGKKRLFDMRTGLLYAGLLPRLEAWAEKHGHELIKVGFPDGPEPVDKVLLKRFLDGLGLPFPPRDYQLVTFVAAIRHRRGTFLAATSSGKSLSIYLIARWLADEYGLKVLLVVPTIGLVKQMESDITSYGGAGYTTAIHGGQTKDADTPIVVSTWQSIHKLDPDWFSQFGVLIADEVHGWKADRLGAIAEKCTTAAFRFGFTGTLDGIDMHQIVIEGLFGPVRKMISTTELIARDLAPRVKIDAVILRWNDTMCRKVLDGSYHEEIDTLVTSRARNNLIVRIAQSLPGNTLILFQLVERHGKVLEQRLREGTSKEIHFIHGKVEADIREEVRHIVEASSNAVILASYGTFSTGVSINRLHNIVFASPTKAPVRLLQSIGRGLRKAADKSQVRIVDLVDDLRSGSEINYAFRHWRAREAVYTSEGFPYVERRIDL